MRQGFEASIILLAAKSSFTLLAAWRVHVIERAMVRYSETRIRLAVLKICTGASILGLRGIRVATGMMIVAAIVCSGSLGLEAAETSSPQAEKEEPTVVNEGGQPNSTRSRPQNLRFQVVRDDNGEPLSDAKITVSLFHPQLRERRELLTDEMGRVDFEYPDGNFPVMLRAMVNRQGFVPYFVNFGSSIFPSALPTEKTIRMDVGKRVGGIVVDPSGNPIAGVVLTITIPATDSPSQIHYQIFEQSTKEDGTWQFDGAPLTYELNVALSHPRFVGERQAVHDRIDGRYILNPGVTLTGRVADETNNPVLGARITIGRDRFGSRDKPTVVENDGTYSVHALKPQLTYVTAEAPGYAPQVIPIDLGENSKPVDFKLLPGHLIQFHVVDRDGNPIEAARIVADTWNGFRTLSWEGKSDVQGQVAWNGAPADNVRFDIVHEDYAYLRSLHLGPQQEPHRIQLLSPLIVSGIVVDANQVKVAKFNVRFGVKDDGRDEIRWNTVDSSNGQNGKFEVKCLESHDEVFLQIEAEGFQSWISEPISFRKTNHKVFVKLNPGHGPSGIVWSPDGTPAVGAQLTLVTAKERMQFTEGYHPYGGKQTLKSDANGRFEFRPCDVESLIVAVHSTGYAEINASDLDANNVLHLHRWAKVEVLVREGNVPLPGASIRIDPIRQSGSAVQVYSHRIQSKTNSEGRAVFERVVPGEVWVSKTIEQPIDGGRIVHKERSERVSLLPGERKYIEIGGSGVTVKGQIKLADDPPEPHDWKLNSAARIHLPLTPTNKERREYRTLVRNDGSFELKDVIPGMYQFELDLTAKPDRNQGGIGAVMGRIIREIEVPATGAVLDLGILEGAWFERLGAGEAAP